MSDFDFPSEYAAIPPHTKRMLLDWVTHGHSGGDFFDAVITGDLFQAVAHADDENLPKLGLIVRWLYNRAPGECVRPMGATIRNQRLTELQTWEGLKP